MRVLGFPYYSPNEYKANSEELHPFLEQLLYSEDEQGTKRLHETAQKHGLKIPEGTVTFKTYIEQILIPMGIEPIEFYRYHEYDPDSPEEAPKQVLGVLPSRFRIHNPKLLMGFQGRIEINNLTKQELQDDRSFIYIAERIPALYAVIRAMAATTPNLRELAAKALKACECTRV